MFYKKLYLFNQVQEFQFHQFRFDVLLAELPIVRYATCLIEITMYNYRFRYL